MFKSANSKSQLGRAVSGIVMSLQQTAPLPHNLQCQVTHVFSRMGSGDLQNNPAKG
jgi:hypothetical protein